MTTATQITLFRIFLIPVFIGLAVYYGQSVAAGAADESLRWWTVAVFAIAAISDAVDGYIARNYNQKSKLGQILDPLADKALLLSAIIVLSLTSWRQHFPLWFPLLVIFRDLVTVGGVALVEYFTGGKCDIHTHWSGKTATVFQIIAVFWIMLDIPFPPLIWPTVIAAALTVFSGIIYLIDGLQQIQRGPGSPSVS